MINIVSSNCRGAGARSFPSLIRELKTKYAIHIFIIVEPRVNGERVEKIITKMGFSKNSRVEAEGYSGGICILWKENQVKIDTISNSSQCIHASIIYREGKESFFLTCVYGSPILQIDKPCGPFLKRLTPR